MNVRQAGFLFLETHESSICDLSEHLCFLVTFQSTITMASDTPTDYEMETLEHEPYPDKIPEGGYGWVCVICTFFINAHTWGINSVCGRGTVIYFFQC